MSAPRHIPATGPGGLLIVCDHASAAVPPDVALGIDPALLSLHIAVDIGAAPLAEALAAATGAEALLAGVSRLVIDLNREEDAPGLIPAISDGHVIPGNADLTPGERAARIARFHRPWHAAIAAAIDAARPALIVSLHSFTPRLADAPVARPWEIGILYNRDRRAAAAALPLLVAAGIVTGDNEPYSGTILNATMNRHAEANAIPYLGIEVRQDLIDSPGGVARWAARLAPVILATRDGLG